MNRRDSLKALGLTAIGSTVLLNACSTDNSAGKKTGKEDLDALPGREAFEIDRVNQLNNETFFDKHEMETITILADIIIPRDDISGSASDAGVPEFIEFIVKDLPVHKLPMRGGLKWLDLQCHKRYSHAFIDCSSSEQIEIIDEIAYPLKAKPEMAPGVAFFTRMRDLTASGFYTSEIGVKDIGFKGNTPNKWDGVPQEEIIKYNL